MELFIDEWNFSGDEEMNTVIGASAITDQSATYKDTKPGVVRITSSDHGYKASPTPFGDLPPNVIFVSGTTNYDGMRKLLAVATNSIDVVAPFVAETPGGSEILRPGFKFGHEVDFHGFEVHLSTASGTVENLVVAVDSAQGAAWDRTLYTIAMNGVQDYIEMCDPPIRIAPGDQVYVTWANTNDTLWGLKLKTSRVV
jgi:hypothetical protein